MKDFEKSRNELLQCEYFDMGYNFFDENQIYMLVIDVPLVDSEGVYKPFTIVITPGDMPRVSLSNRSVISFNKVDIELIGLLSSMLTNVERILSKCSIAKDIPEFSSESISIYIKTKTKNYHLLCIEEDTKNYVENLIQILYTGYQIYGRTNSSEVYVQEYPSLIEDIKRINKRN